MKIYNLVVFDVDGTLGDPPGIDRRDGQDAPYRFRTTPDDWVWYLGRKEMIAQLLASGIKISLATNQGGVAYGHLDKDAMMQWLIELSLEIGATGCHVCFTHPEAPLAEFKEDSYDRKPYPGMLFKAMAFHYVTVYETLFVGDRVVDQETAKNAGVGFMYAKDFFTPPVIAEIMEDDNE